MEYPSIDTLTGQLQLILETNKQFSQKLKQRLFLESSHVTNPYKFIAGLLSEGVLCDGSPDSEADYGLREMMVQHAMMIACSKGAGAVGGWMKALEKSGNSRLILDLTTWAIEDFGSGTKDDDGSYEDDDVAHEDDDVLNEVDNVIIRTTLYEESDLGESEEDVSDVLPPPGKKLRENSPSPTEMRSTGTNLMDKIVSRVDEEGFIEKLEGYLVGKVSEIANAAEFCSSLADQNVFDETNIELTYGQKSEGEPLTEKALKAVFSQRAFGRLVIALQSSKNARFLEETNAWVEIFQVGDLDRPTASTSRPNQPVIGPTATGIFAGTSSGLISLDLQTLEATALTTGFTSAIAVNPNLKKVYWVERAMDYCIMDSDFDGSCARKIISQPTDDSIDMLAIDEASGNIYFAAFTSHKIKVCNALGHYCVPIISNSTLVKCPVGIALDSIKGFVYWGMGESGSHSIVRANLDGSNPTVISTGFSVLRGITLDQPSSDVIYWVDGGDNTIGTIDVNSGNKRELVKPEGSPSPWSIQVDTHNIYFSNFYRGNIQSVNRDSGEELAMIFNSTGVVYHLALFNEPVNSS